MRVAHANVEQCGCVSVRRGRNKTKEKKEEATKADKIYDNHWIS